VLVAVPWAFQDRGRSVPTAALLFQVRSDRHWAGHFKGVTRPLSASNRLAPETLSKCGALSSGALSSGACSSDRSRPSSGNPEVALAGQSRLIERADQHGPTRAVSRGSVRARAISRGQVSDPVRRAALPAGRPIPRGDFEHATDISQNQHLSVISGRRLVRG